MYLSAKDIQKRLGIGHSSFYKHVAPHLTSVRIGASVRYTLASVLAYEERISGNATTTPLAPVK
jgi:predicted DNA-binding transcriptional regulator AlpA